MRFKLTIQNPDITWDEFRNMITSNTDTREILKACYTKSSRRRGLGFSKKN